MTPEEMEAEAARLTAAATEAARRHLQPLWDMLTTDRQSERLEMLDIGISAGISGATEAMGELFDLNSSMRCPRCPLCGGPPLVIGGNVASVFCPADECDVLIWDAYRPAAENLRNTAEVKLTRNESSDGGAEVGE